MNLLLVYGTPVRRSVLEQARQELGADTSISADLICWAAPEDDVHDLVDTVIVLRPGSAATTAGTRDVVTGPEPIFADNEPDNGEPEDEDPDEPPVSPHLHALAALPRWHPRRLGHGLGWRWRRVKRRLRPLTRRLRRLTWITAKHPGHVFWRHAHGRAGVSTVVERADLIVAMDNVASLTCWHLARTTPDTPTVLGVSEGRRRLNGLRSTGQVRT